MAKKKQTEEVVEKVETVEEVAAEVVQIETKEEDVVVSKPLSGGAPLVEKVKLVAKKVFEPMQGVFRTVWEKQ